jgi:heparan-alpha-glucosaminide N-acetyltransferase
MTTSAAPALSSPASRQPSPAPDKVRIVSIDVFRGFVMFLMLAEVMRLWTLHQAFPDSTFWAIVAFNTTHVPWQGCSLHDLIQPAFSFLAGASLPFSIASRKGRGESFGQMLGHAIWRSVLLMLLGIFLRSMESRQTYWTFEDTLTQIGLGYTFLFLLAFTSFRT